MDGWVEPMVCFVLFNEIPQPSVDTRHLTERMKNETREKQKRIENKRERGKQKQIQRIRELGFKENLIDSHRLTHPHQLRYHNKID